MYYVLLICFLILLLFSYRCLDKDILQPSVILCGYGVFATVIGFVNYDYWHLYEYGADTTGILLCGVASFVAGSIIARYIIVTTGKRKKSNAVTIKTHDYKHSRLEISSIVKLLCVTLTFITFLAFLMFFKKVTNASSLASAITNFKAVKLDEDYSMPLYLNLLIKILSALSYSCLYVIIYNSIAKKLSLDDLLIAFVPVIYMILSLMMANRGNLLMLVMGAFAAWYILWHRVYGWNISLNSKALKKGIKITAITLVLFWAFIIFRTNRSFADVGKGYSFFTYISNYVSGGLESFDLYLKQGGKTCSWFGEETFVVLNNNLHTLFGISEVSTRPLEYRSGYGRSVPNIYTAIRRFYHDFGWTGVVLLPFFQGWLSTKIYKKARYTKSGSIIDLSMAVYCYYFYTIPYMLIEDFFYSSNISITGLLRFVIFVVCYELFFNKARLIDFKSNETDAAETEDIEESVNAET